MARRLYLRPSYGGETGGTSTGLLGDPAAGRPGCRWNNECRKGVYLDCPEGWAFKHLGHFLTSTKNVLPSFTPLHMVQLPALQQEHCSSLQQSPHSSDLQHGHSTQHGFCMHILPETDCDCVLVQAVMNAITMNGKSFLNIKELLVKLIDLSRWTQSAEFRRSFLCVEAIVIGDMTCRPLEGKRCVIEGRQALASGRQR